MKRDYVLSILFLSIILICVSYYNQISNKMQEGYSNYNLEGAIGKIPEVETNVLVQDTYPITGINGISDNSASDIWKWDPVFQLGSYKQITNNIRYPYRPSNGSCTPASMCGALYKENKDFIGKNYVYPEPPVSDYGTRVGYFSSSVESLLL